MHSRFRYKYDQNFLFSFFFFALTPLAVGTIIGIQLRLAAIPALVSAALVVGGQIKLGMMVADWRVHMTKVTDRRVKLTSSFIDGIRQVKMFAWEESLISKFKAVSNLLFFLISLSEMIKVRSEEMKLIKQSLIVKGITFTLAIGGYAIISLVGLLSYVGIGYKLTPDIVSIILFSEMNTKKAFTAQTLFGILTAPLANAPKAFQSFGG